MHISNKDSDWIRLGHYLKAIEYCAVRDVANLGGATEVPVVGLVRWYQRHPTEAMGDQFLHEGNNTSA